MSCELLITRVISRVESVVNNTEPMGYVELMLEISKNCQCSEMLAKRAIKFWRGAGNLQSIDKKYHWTNEPQSKVGVAADLPMRISSKAKNTKVKLNPDWWTSLLQVQA